MITRRFVLSGLLAAPLVVKADRLMLLRGEKMLPDIAIPEWCPPGWVPANGRTVSKFQFPELHSWMAKIRQGGAERSANFSLPVGKGNFQWFSGYDAVSFSTRLDVKYAPHEIVTLVNTVPMRRPNGQICQPGMLCDYQVSGPAAVLGAPYRVQGTALT